ncbi:hypothetical protein I35_0891 [Burkholderia cenocepacia H111]|nr:uncharacterized protein BCN122_I2794 [Burkholderia cenocepacia]ARF88769.1 uncharacterized protein BCN122_II2026 [Burkholderia cenocepacia]CDN59414.1 hypothetical protein I35_0891 [Burkholderia cenocepacia H111]
MTRAHGHRCPPTARRVTTRRRHDSRIMPRQADICLVARPSRLSRHPPRTSRPQTGTRIRLI